MSDRDTPVPPEPAHQQVRATSKSQEIALLEQAVRRTSPSATYAIKRLNELRRRSALEFAEEVARDAPDKHVRKLA